MATPTNQNDSVLAAVARKHQDLELIMRAAEIAPQYGFVLSLAAHTESASSQNAAVRDGAATRSTSQPAKETDVNAPRRTGFTAVVRGIYKAYTQDFSIRTIKSELDAKHPDLASAENVSINISAILGRARDKGELELVSQGAAGNPSIYRNLRSEEESHDGFRPEAEKETM